MSGPLLVGIVAVGGLWVLGSRRSYIDKCHRPSSKRPDRDNPPADDTAPIIATDTADAIAGGADAGDGFAAIGGDKVIGAEPGAQSVPVVLGDTDGKGGVTPLPEASTGGADPDTQRSGAGGGGTSSGFWAGPEGKDADDDPRRKMPDDPVAAWIRAKHGSADGLSRQQLAECFREVQTMTGEIVV